LGNDVGRFQVCSGRHGIYSSRPQMSRNWKYFGRIDTTADGH
jgi:hypothetical protein